jgi:hypothetical protein
MTCKDLEVITEAKMQSAIKKIGKGKPLAVEISLTSRQLTQCASAIW